MKNWLLPGSLVILALISIVILKSIAPQLASMQAVFFMVGGIIFYSLSRLHFRSIQQLSWLLYGLLLAGLVVSFLYGTFTGNTGRWIPIFIINIQPSQLAVPIVALVLSSMQHSFNAHQSFNDTRQLIRSLAVIALPAVLILIEPDLGTTIVYLASTGIILFASELSWKKIRNLAAIGLVTAVFAWLFVLQPYQKQRITSFMDSSQDTQDASYNARQALIAAGSGQLMGRGLGEGVQSHLRFLPERQTDFIFASFAEEFGFVGSIILLSLYVCLIGSIITIGLQSSKKSYLFYTLSIATMTAIQAGVNIGMNIGLLPITGLTLPFVSYGGSSILSLAASYGLVASIARTIQSKAVLHLS